jgi:hypothetical protein
MMLKTPDLILHDDHNVTRIDWHSLSVRADLFVHAIYRTWATLSDNLER